MGGAGPHLFPLPRLGAQQGLGISPLGPHRREVVLDVAPHGPVAKSIRNPYEFIGLGDGDARNP